MNSDAPALALLEFDSVAAGIEAGDAMVKQAPVAFIRAGTVQPGYYLALVAGDVASVAEAVAAGEAVGQAAWRDTLFLPNVHQGVVAALHGERPSPSGEALGVIETHKIASAVRAADAGLKGAEVTLIQLRLGDGLGGKGVVLFTGLVADVEAAVEIGAAVARQHLLRQTIIAQMHAEMWDNVAETGRFGRHFNWEAL